MGRIRHCRSDDAHTVRHRGRHRRVTVSRFLAADGHIFVTQDIRGRYRSDSSS
jgi:predicted acyl esterase